MIYLYPTDFITLRGTAELKETDSAELVWLECNPLCVPHCVAMCGRSLRKAWRKKTRREFMTEQKNNV